MLRTILMLLATCFIVTNVLFPGWQLTGLQKYEEVLGKINAEVIQKSQASIVPTVSVIMCCCGSFIFWSLSHDTLECLSRVM